MRDTTGLALSLTTLLLSAFFCGVPKKSGAQANAGTAHLIREESSKRTPQNEQEKQQARQKIGITVQQQKAIETLFAETEKQEDTIRARLRSLYETLHNLYDSYDLDEKQARATREEIGTQQQSLLTLNANNENKLRRILNRQQFERLRAQMKADRHRSGRPHHRDERKEEN